MLKYQSSFILEKKPCYLCVEFHQLQKKSNQRVEIAFIKFVGRSKWCQIKFCIIIFPEAVAPFERNNMKTVNYTKKPKRQLLILYRRNLNSVEVPLTIEIFPDYMASHKLITG